MLNLYTEPRRCWIAYLRVELSSCSIELEGLINGFGIQVITTSLVRKAEDSSETTSRLEQAIWLIW